jgi:hypothetical protein
LTWARLRVVRRELEAFAVFRPDVLFDVAREAVARRAPRVDFGLVEPPPVARARAEDLGRDVLRLAMTRPFRAETLTVFR